MTGPHQPRRRRGRRAKQQLLELQRARQVYISHHRGDLEALARVEHAIGRQEQTLVRSVEACPPAYIAAAFGSRPEGPNARAAWRAAVHHVETYRTRHDVVGSGRLLGTAPRRAGERQEHQQAARRLEQLTAALAEARNRAAARTREEVRDEQERASGRGLA